MSEDVSKGHPTLTQPQSLQPSPPTPEMPPEVRDLLTKLMDDCTTLVIKLATCECNHKDGCAVFRKAQGIAKVIDKLTELRGKGVLGGTSSG